MNIFELKRERERKKFVLHHLRKSKDKTIKIELFGKEIEINKDSLETLIYNEKINDTFKIKKL